MWVSCQVLFDDDYIYIYIYVGNRTPRRKLVEELLRRIPQTPPKTTHRFALLTIIIAGQNPSAGVSGMLLCRRIFPSPPTPTHIKGVEGRRGVDGTWPKSRRTNFLCGTISASMCRRIWPRQIGWVVLLQWKPIKGSWGSLVWNGICDGCGSLYIP